jgi:hypothetical protein
MPKIDKARIGEWKNKDSKVERLALLMQGARTQALGHAGRLLLVVWKSSDNADVCLFGESFDILVFKSLWTRNEDIGSPVRNARLHQHGPM